MEKYSFRKTYTKVGPQLRLLHGCQKRVIFIREALFLIRCRLIKPNYDLKEPEAVTQYKSLRVVLVDFWGLFDKTLLLL